MITKLTKQQEEMMFVVRDSWLNKMFGGFKEIDKKEAIEGINWLYKISGLNKPKVIFVNSPAGCQLACNILGESQVGSQVWSQVRSQVESQVRSQVWSQVGSQVWSQVWSQVESQVGSQVRSQVGSQVWSQVGSQVRSQVESQVESQVGSQVWSQVRSQGSRLFSFSSYGNIWDYGWLSFYEFFEQLGVVKSKLFTKFIDLLNSNIYDMVQLDKFCIVCEKPDFISRDTENRLHNESRSAIHWRDGYEQHYLYGVYFDEELWLKVVSRSMEFKEIMDIQNMEQRMVALKMYNPDKLLENTNAKLLDKSQRGNELYLVEKVFSQPAYFLRYVCPSTQRVYISGIDPTYAKDNLDADSCMAWKHGLTPNEYQILSLEA